MTNLLDNINNLMQITEVVSADTIKHALIGTGLLAGTAGAAGLGSYISNLDTDLIKSKNTMSNNLETLKSNIYSGLGGAAAGATAALGIGAIGKSLYRKSKPHPIDENNTLGNIAKVLGGVALAGGGAAAGYNASDFFNNKSLERSHIENELNRYNSNINVGLKSAGAGAAGAIGLGLLGHQLSKSNDLRMRSKQEDPIR